MSRYISNYEMRRRGALIAAKSDLLTAMELHELTATEWVCVLEELMARMVQYGLREEWAEPEIPEGTG